MKKLIVSLIILVFIILGSFSYAQDRIVKSDFWFTNLNYLKFGKKWSIGNEVHIRRTDFLKKWEQFLVRPWLTYKPNDHFSVSTGYSYIRTYPYAPYMKQTHVQEHNVWEQITLFHQSKKVKFSHRIRLEQRFRENQVEQSDLSFERDGFLFSQRFRYRLTIKVPFAKRFFFMAFNEIWIKTNGNFTQPKYDRNWLYLGFGVKPFKNATIQLGYLHQANRIGGDRDEIHPTLALQWQYDIPIKIKK